MQTKHWDQVKDLLDKVLELDISERQKFLDKCDANQEIRAEVASLISFETEAENLMNLSAIEFSKDFFSDGDAPNQLIGQNIGAYQIVREIGFGGMGAVYLAERNDGKFEQKVALKLLKREMNTAALRRGFQREREILASLEHPNIARLLDAGATEDKIPYLAMEYIEGVPIDVYCQKQNLNLDERLNLFRQICTAVNFAHRNLVVHRDLKPSNILVTDDGIPKLLDFGISKILSKEFDQIDSATVTRMGAMTPSYASPEQLQQKSVTTATDIYSLGVILYELLSGHRPFETKEDSLKDIFSAVLETDPLPPSAMVDKPAKLLRAENVERPEKLRPDIYELSTLLDNQQTHKTERFSGRQTTPKLVYLSSNSLRGDLDNIVLKALRKEPDRRYSSAENFAEDIRRHQQGLPVTARPNTLSYRAEKFIKRNSLAVVASSLVLVAIIGGIVATLWQARIAQAERAKAERRFGDVRKLANSYLFDVYPEIENIEGSLKVREKIITNALQYLDSLSNEASNDLVLQSELATAYEKIGDVLGALKNSSLGNIQAGLDNYKKAQKLRESILNADPINFEAKDKLVSNNYTIARTLWMNSQTKDAEEMFEKAIKLQRELVSAQPDSVEMQNRLAVLLIDYGAIPVFNSQNDKALVLFNEALQIVERLRQKQPENSDFKKTQTRLLRVMSKAQTATGKFDEGIKALNQAIEISNELAKEFPKDFRVQRSVWLTHLILCELYIFQKDEMKTVETCPPTIEFPQTALQKEPENGVVAYDLAISHFNSARAYRIGKNYPKTVEHSEKALEVMTQLLKKSPDNLDYKRNLAIYETEKVRALIELKEADKSISALNNVINILNPILEADGESTKNLYDLSIAYRLMAKAYMQKTNKIEALKFIEKSIENIKKLKEINSLDDSDKNLLDELENEKAELMK